MNLIANIRKPFYLNTRPEIQKFLNEEGDTEQNFGAIILTNELTKEQLHKYIDDDWEYIKEEMEQWFPVFPSEGSKFTNLLISN